MRSTALIPFVYLVVLGCTVAGPGSPEGLPGPKADAWTDPTCADPALTEAVEWNRLRSSLMAVAGAARHSAREPVVWPGDEVVIEGKFSYGIVAKDLEEELVAGYLRVGDCADPDGGWIDLGQGLTDTSGRLAFEVDPELVVEPGSYEFQLVVLGDLSRARGRVWVAPAGAPTVVFDVDGTLTTSDAELRDELLHGDSPEIFEGAAEVTRRWAHAGALVVYLTARPNMLSAQTRRWLEDNGAAPGVLRTTTNLVESSPLAVRWYKTDELVELLDWVELDVVAAYGNATTDVCAYAAAGLDPERTFIVGEHGGSACEGYGPTQVLDSWSTHGDEVMPGFLPAAP